MVEWKNNNMHGKGVYAWTDGTQEIYSSDRLGRRPTTRAQGSYAPAVSGMERTVLA